MKQNVLGILVVFVVAIGCLLHSYIIELQKQLVIQIEQQQSNSKSNSTSEFEYVTNNDRNGTIIVVSTINKQHDNDIVYPKSFNDTIHPLNPLLSKNPESTQLLYDETDDDNYIFFYNRMIKNRHTCIYHIRAKHNTILQPIILPLLQLQDNEQKQQQQQQQQLKQQIQEEENNEPIEDTNNNSNTTKKQQQNYQIESSVLIVDPAYHENVGDHMLTLGEIQFIKLLQYNNNLTRIISEQCNYDQARAFVQSCTTYLDNKKLQLQLLYQNQNQTTIQLQIHDNEQQQQQGNNNTNKRLLALWHAGGNWGNLYPYIQEKRIKSFEQLLVAGYDPIISMPQSLYYTKNDNGINAAKHDSEQLAYAIATAYGLLAVPPNTKNPTKNPISAISILQNYTSIVQQKIYLTWREKYSYNEAIRLYPFVTNILVPDIAFQLGPFNGTNYKNTNTIASSDTTTSTTTTTTTTEESSNTTQRRRRRTKRRTSSSSSSLPAVDIVFLLRVDGESVYSNIRKNTHLLQSMINNATQLFYNDTKNQQQRKRRRRRRQLLSLEQNYTNTTISNSSNTANSSSYNNLTFAVYDWKSREELFDIDNYFFTHTAIELLASGKVIIVDRLHAGILSYLSGLPLILLDNVSHKINHTLEVAFDTWSECYNTDHAMYTTATSIEDSITYAVEFIHKYHL